MEIKALKREDLKEAAWLYNQAATSRQTIFKPVSEEKFDALFINGREGFQPVCLAAYEEERIIGFAAGNTSPKLDKGYITYVQIISEKQRMGCGRKLLSELEAKLKEVNQAISKFEILFTNPSNLVWLIPGKNGADHPNAPGLDMQSPAHLFFQNMGYRNISYQNCYYLELKNYALPSDIEQKKEELLKRGLVITTYDPLLHNGFPDLFDNLENEDWRTIITENTNRPDGGDPVLIVSHKGKVCGFTGPMAIQESGRGYFAGIGVHSDFRGGSGKVLFASLCMGLKGIGADFMTLFTAETNPARNIYEAAGFKIVRSFADMRKEEKHAGR